MEQWLDSIYSDGSKYFVSNPLPHKGERVSISIRMLDRNIVEKVFLRTKLNGAEKLIAMQKSRVDRELAYYTCDVTIYEDVLHYQFYLVTAEKIYYYTQYRITDYIPDETWDFRIITDYAQPIWVTQSVFYQIFPERFYNGNKSNDVKDGEYSFNGHGTVQVKEWNTPPREYNQTHSLDFYGGDLEGIRQKIPYLKALGINALYINPIFQAATVHKYDCIDYFEVDPHFGGNAALAALTKELHDNNMKIILDISINHTGSASKWFNKNAEFFPESTGAYHNKEAKERNFYFFKENNEYDAWFGTETLPALNYTSEELRRIIYKDRGSVIKKWLKPPYDIDGWRFDVADVMARNNEVQLHHEIWPEIRVSIKEEKAEAYILAEDWSDCTEFLQGNEWDSPMNYFACARPVREFVGEEDLFNEREEELRGIPYKMTANNLHNRIIQYYSKLPYTMQQIQFNFIDSHDISRLHNSRQIRGDDYRSAVILYFTLPGAPSIYYGDEIGISGHTDNIESNRYPMNWDDDMSKREVYQLYHQLALLKRSSEALQSGGFKVVSDNDFVICYVRFIPEETIIVICSTDEETREVNIPVNIFGIRHFNITEDLFHNKLQYQYNGTFLIMKVPPHTSYIFCVPCQ